MLMKNNSFYNVPSILAGHLIALVWNLTFCKRHSSEVKFHTRLTNIKHFLSIFVIQLIKFVLHFTFVFDILIFDTKMAMPTKKTHFFCITRVQLSNKTPNLGRVYLGIEFCAKKPKLKPAHFFASERIKHTHIHFKQ